MNIAYKIVNERDGKLTSCVASGKYKLTYPVKEIVKAPEGTLLFVFRKLPTREQIRQVVGISHFNIYRCVTDDFQECQAISIEFKEENMDIFWGSKNHLDEPSFSKSTSYPLSNTAFVKEVMLLEKVSNSEIN